MFFLGIVRSISEISPARTGVIGLSERRTFDGVKAHLSCRREGACLKARYLDKSVSKPVALAA
jgi:hypothetical protein